MKHEKLFDAALLLNRLTLGSLFLLAGIRKLIPTGEATFAGNLRGFAEQVAGMAPLPQPLGLAYGYTLPFVEIVAGAFLILGLFTRPAAVVILLMLVSFIVEFGIAWWPDEGPAFDKNVVYVTLAFLLAVTGAGKLSLDHGWVKKRKR